MKSGRFSRYYPDSKTHVANVGPTWGRQDPGGPHVGHMNLAIWVNFLVWGQENSMSIDHTNLAYVVSLEGEFQLILTLTETFSISTFVIIATI